MHYSSVKRSWAHLQLDHHAIDCKINEASNNVASGQLESVAAPSNFFW